MENIEYYFMRGKEDQPYPHIKIVDEEEDDDGNIILMELEFNTPIPRNPVMADFLYGAYVILSKRIIEEIRKFDPEGVDFIPTELTDPKGNMSDEYMVVIPSDENYYEALDKEKSDFEYKHGGYWINKLVLNKEVLNKIPLKRRLICALTELRGKTLFHKSLVDAILALDPSGVNFVNIEDYDF